MSIEYIRVTVIQKLGPNSFVIQCAFCEGKGREPTHMGDGENHYREGESSSRRIGYWEVLGWHKVKKCPVCDGKGVLRVESPDIPIKDARCYGTGHEPGKDGHATVKRCKTCKGVGARSLTGHLRVLK